MDTISEKDEINYDTETKTLSINNIHDLDTKMRFYPIEICVANNEIKSVNEIIEIIYNAIIKKYNTSDNEVNLCMLFIIVIFIIVIFIQIYYIIYTTKSKYLYVD